MKLKLNDAGFAEVVDGKPVYIHDDGKEVPFDAGATVQTISRLNGEAKNQRERAEAAEKTLKTFEGIDDPAAAIKALNTVANLDMKKLVDAGEVEKVSAEIRKVFEAKLNDVTEKAQALEQQLYGEKIGGSFARSKMIAEKLAIPADLVQARFGNNFKIEDGKIVAYDTSGNKIYSRTNPGNLAEFDESLEFLIEQYPHKESILKGSVASGGGANNSSNSSTGNSKTMNRTAFDSLAPDQKMAHIKGGGTVSDQ